MYSYNYAEAAPKRVREGLKADTILNWLLRNELELSGEEVQKTFSGKGNDVQRYRGIAH